MGASILCVFAMHKDVVPVLVLHVRYLQNSMPTKFSQLQTFFFQPFGILPFYDLKTEHVDLYNSSKMSSAEYQAHLVMHRMRSLITLAVYGCHSHA